MIFKTGIHEVRRKAVRLLDRIRLLVENRKLIKAETTLGLLGWQQVDYDSPELEVQVAKIHETEKAQLELMNERAGLSALIESLKAEMESSRRIFAEQTTEIEHESAPARLQFTELSARAAEGEKILSRFKEGIADLQTRENNLGSIFKKLSLQPETGVVLEEINRNKHQRSVLQLEIKELESNCSRQESVLSGLKTAMEPVQASLSRFDLRMRTLQQESSANERRIEGKIREAERGKERIGKQIESLNRKKAHPYRLIGRCLADEGIPPMNQPEALEQVLEIRQVIGEIQSKIEQSQVLSAQADRRELRIFYALSFLALVVLAVESRLFLQFLH